MIQASIDAISKDNTPDPSERLLNQHQMELQPPSGVGAEPSFAAESGVPASAPAGPGANSFGDNPPDNLSKEVKLALGLLLKHRGGPGFGHGRFGIHHLPHPSL